LPVDELTRIALGILHMGERRRVRLFVSRDQFGRFASCIVYLPRDRYTTAVRLDVLAALRDAFDATDVDYTALVTESVLARLHVVLSAPGGVGDVDELELEARLAQVARAWIDDFADALTAARGEEGGLDTLRAWSDAFPAAYRDEVPAAEAVVDLV